MSLAGCSGEESNVVIGPPDSTGGIKIPMDIHKAITADGTLRAFVSVPGVVEKQPMTVEDLDQDQIPDQARATISGVPVGSHDFTVEFAFEALDFNGTFTLARATKNLAVVEGSDNTLDFDIADYSDDFDTDDDKLTNLFELENNLDPSSKICVVGFSLVGRCTLGS